MNIRSSTVVSESPTALLFLKGSWIGNEQSYWWHSCPKVSAHRRAEHWKWAWFSNTSEDREWLRTTHQVAKRIIPKEVVFGSMLHQTDVLLFLTHSPSIVLQDWGHIDPRDQHSWCGRIGQVRYFSERWCVGIHWQQWSSANNHWLQQPPGRMLDGRSLGHEDQSLFLMNTPNWMVCMNLIPLQSHAMGDCSLWENFGYSEPNHNRITWREMICLGFGFLSESLGKSYQHQAIKRSQLNSCLIDWWIVVQLVDEAYHRWLIEEEGIADDVSAVIAKFIHP